MKKTSTGILIVALRGIAWEKRLTDELASATLTEAADRIKELSSAVEIGVEYSREILAIHDRDIGRDRPQGKLSADRIEEDIKQMQEAIK